MAKAFRYTKKVVFNVGLSVLFLMEQSIIEQAKISLGNTVYIFYLWEILNKTCLYYGPGINSDLPWTGDWPPGCLKPSRCSGSGPWLVLSSSPPASYLPVFKSWVGYLPQNILGLGVWETPLPTLFPMMRKSNVFIHSFSQSVSQQILTRCLVYSEPWEFRNAALIGIALKVGRRVTRFLCLTMAPAHSACLPLPAPCRSPS